MELNHYLNLTMIQICEHHHDLYELDTKLLIFNKTLSAAIEVVNHVRYTLSVLIDVSTAVT